MTETPEVMRQHIEETKSQLWEKLDTLESQVSDAVQAVAASFKCVPIEGTHLSACFVVLSMCSRCFCECKPLLPSFGTPPQHNKILPLFFGELCKKLC